MGGPRPTPRCHAPSPRAGERRRDRDLPAPLGKRLRDDREPAPCSSTSSSRSGRRSCSSRWTGRRTVGDLVVERLEGSGGLDADARDRAGRGLVTEAGSSMPPPIGCQRAARGPPVRPLVPRAVRSLSVSRKTLSIDWTGADRLVRWCYRIDPSAVLHAVAGRARGWPRRGRGASPRSSTLNASGRFSIGGEPRPPDSADPAHPGFRPDVRARARRTLVVHGRITTAGSRAPASCSTSALPRSSSRPRTA